MKKLISYLLKHERYIKGFMIYLYFKAINLVARFMAFMMFLSAFSWFHWGGEEGFVYSYVLYVFPVAVLGAYGGYVMVERRALMLVYMRDCVGDFGFEPLASLFEKEVSFAAVRHGRERDKYLSQSFLLLPAFYFSLGLPLIYFCLNGVLEELLDLIEAFLWGSEKPMVSVGFVDAVVSVLAVLIFLASVIFADLWLKDRDVKARDGFIDGVSRAGDLIGLLMFKFGYLVIPYLLVGLFFSGGWYFMHIADVGSLKLPNELGFSFFDSIYYSFVTMTTLGYGEITPVTGIAKWLTILQSVFGIFYMAIVIGVAIGYGLSLSKVGELDSTSESGLDVDTDDSIRSASTTPEPPSEQK